MVRSQVRHSIIGPDARFQGAALHHSVLQPGAYVESGADIDHCIIMEGARIAEGVRLRNSIVGSGNMLTQDMCSDYAWNGPSCSYPRTPAGVLLVPPCAARGGMRAAALG